MAQQPSFVQPPARRPVPAAQRPRGRPPAVPPAPLPTSPRVVFRRQEPAATAVAIGAVMIGAAFALVLVMLFGG